MKRAFVKVVYSNGNFEEFVIKFIHGAASITEHKDFLEFEVEDGKVRVPLINVNYYKTYVID
jgi:hypothetical protein